MADGPTITFGQTATAELAIPDFSEKRAEFRGSSCLGCFDPLGEAGTHAIILKYIHYINGLGCVGWAGRIRTSSTSFDGA